MDFSLTPDQQALKLEVSEFAATLNADVQEHDEKKVFPQDKWSRCAEMGLHGLQVPEPYGGRGFGLLTSVIAMEAFGLGCRDNGLAFTLNGQLLIQLPLIHCGTESQKRQFLPGMAKGACIGAFAFTEPTSGSDLYSISTRADKVEGGYRLNGTKALISYAPIADFAIVFGTINPALGKWGLTAFIVDLSAEGVSVSEPRTKMGLRTVPSGEIEFSDCFVPEAGCLGKEGAGVGILNRALE